MILVNKLYSGTTLTIIPNPATGLTESDFGLPDMTTQLEDTTDLNGPYIADAFALSNILGYPIGKAYLGSFPHFEIGVAGGAGCTNMKYFDDEYPASDNGSLPGIAPTLVTHFGIGLFGGFDALGKMFYISKSAINKYKDDIDYETDVATLSDFLIYSAGAKLRYNWIKKKRFLPFYLAFGGVTLSLGGNFMYGKIKFLGDYEYPFEDISISGIPTGVDMDFDGQFGADINWAIFTLDTQAVAYFDIFYIFSLYSGFGLAGNYGSFDLKFSGLGEATTDDVAYSTLFGTDQVGTVVFLSENKYRPSYVMPLYILGLEINIYVVKLNFETMVNLRNGSDVTVQFGTRVEI